jgi:hypothetical protein
VTKGKILVSSIYFTIRGTGTGRARADRRYMKAQNANCYLFAKSLKAVLTGPGGYYRTLSTYLSRPTNRTVYLRGTMAPRAKGIHTFTVTAPAGVPYSMIVVQ